MEIQLHQIIGILQTYTNFVFVQYQKSEKLVSESQVLIGKKAEVIYKFWCFFGNIKPSEINDATPMVEIGVDTYNKYVFYFGSTPLEQSAKELFNQIYPE